MITQNLIPQKLMTFEYYVNKLPMYLRQSKSFMEHFRIWYDVLGKQGEITTSYITETVNFDVEELETVRTGLQISTTESSTFTSTNGTINFYANEQVLNAIKQANKHYNLNCNKIAFATLTIMPSDQEITDTSSKITGKVFLYQDNAVATNMFCQKFCQTVTINANIDEDLTAKSEAWCALVVNAILNEINETSFGTTNYYTSNYTITTDETGPAGTTDEYVQYTGNDIDVNAIKDILNYNADTDIINIANSAVFNNINILSITDNTSEGYIYTVDFVESQYTFTETIDPNTGIIGNAFLLLNMLNIFAKDYFTFLQNYIGSSSTDTVSDILDKIAYLFGVSRNIKVTYTDYEGELHTNEQLSLNNNELLILIKARIIQNYCDGSLEQVNEYYQSVGLNIAVNTDQTIAATANLYLIQEQQLEMSNIDKMFLAGLLVIESMGIEYKPQRLIPTNIMIWDSTDTAIGWDGGNWIS